MRFVKFVQSGDYEQSDNNGMGSYVYSIGASSDYGSSYRILTSEGLSGEDWSIPEESATTFKLQFILEKKTKPTPDWVSF